MSATLEKSEARYTPKATGNENCGGCSMYIRGGSCTLVKGVISPAGWCKHFEPKEKT
jgi:hypothetical protein